jgi:response regulator RpfG family c-di-GMP phosphodiesterase
MLHLVKRFLGSFATAPLSDSEQEWVRDALNVAERDLWRSQAMIDQRHSCDIAKRFVALRPQATRDEIAGALLHDIGKIEAGLGIIARVVATVLPLPTRRFSAYRDHQRRGAQLLQTIGCSETTISLVAGHPDSEALRALCQADDI